MLKVHGYTATGAIDATINGTRWIVPDDMSNGFRQMIRDKWEFDADGNRINTIPAYVPPVLGPSDYTLTKRQINAALILSGKTTDPDGFVTGIIEAITDPTQRALALNDWRNAPFYKRDHQLFNDPDLLAEAGMTSANIDALWMLAKDQPA